VTPVVPQLTRRGLRPEKIKGGGTLAPPPDVVLPKLTILFRAYGPVMIVHEPLIIVIVRLHCGPIEEPVFLGQSS